MVCEGFIVRILPAPPPRSLFLLVSRKLFPVSRASFWGLFGGVLSELVQKFRESGSFSMFPSLDPVAGHRNIAFRLFTLSISFPPCRTVS